eukprot:3537610-Rhodomonas_salina.1
MMWGTEIGYGATRGVGAGSSDEADRRAGSPILLRLKKLTGMQEALSSYACANTQNCIAQYKTGHRLVRIGTQGLYDA